jgi:hypothetical protein
MHALIGVKTGEFSCSIEDFMPMIHPSDRERVRQELKDVLAAGSDYESKYMVVWPSSTIHYLHEGQCV